MRESKRYAPAEWSRYLTEAPMALEIVPWYLFHRKKLTDPRRIHFFGQVYYGDLANPNDEDTNMNMPGMLPNPCSYLIEGVRIFGLPSSLLNGRIRMNIGNKRVIDTNVLAYVERWKLRDVPLVIAPLTCFEAWIEWYQPHVFGLERIPLITVMFKGQMARAIQ